MSVNFRAVGLLACVVGWLPAVAYGFNTDQHHSATERVTLGLASEAPDVVKFGGRISEWTGGIGLAVPNNTKAAEQLAHVFNQNVFICNVPWNGGNWPFIDREVFRRYSNGQYASEDVGEEGAYVLIGSLLHLVEDQASMPHGANIHHGSCIGAALFDGDQFENPTSKVAGTLARQGFADVPRLDAYGGSLNVTKLLVPAFRSTTQFDSTGAGVRYWIRSDELIEKGGVYLGQATPGEEFFGEYGGIGGSDIYSDAEQPGLYGQQATQGTDFAYFFLQKMSRALPPRGVDLVIGGAGAGETPVINSQTGTQITFRLTENRQRVVRVDLRVRDTGQTIISEETIFGLEPNHSVSGSLETSIANGPLSWNQRETPLFLTRNDDLTSLPFESYVDVKWKGEVSGTALADGQHELCLSVIDADGNVSGDTCKTVLVDKTKPVVELWAENRTILLKDRAFNVYRTVTVSVDNSDGAGGGELEVFRVDPIDGRLVSQGKVPLDHSKRDYGSTDLGVLGNLPMGDIVFRATDAAGNSVDHHYTVTQDPVPLDTTDPLISAFSQVPERTVQASWQGDAPFNRLWLNNQVRSKDTLRGLAFGFDDSLGSGLSYVEIRGPEVNISRAFIGDDHADVDVTLLPDAPRLDPGGGPAYTVTAYDRQGNRSSARFNLDSIPPNFSDLKLKVGPDLTVSAKVSAFDNGSGVYEIGRARASPPAGTIGSLELAGEFVISQPQPDRPTLVIEEPGTIALTDAAGLANDLNPYAFMRKREIFTAGAGQTEQPVASGEFTRIRGVKCVSGCPVQVEIRSAGIPLPPPPPIEGNVPIDFEASISTQVFSLTATDVGVPVDITVAGDFTVKRGGETDGVIEIDADTLYGNGWKEPPAFHASPGLDVTLNSPYLNLTLAQVPPSNEETRVAITPATVSPPLGYLFPPGSPEFALNVTISGPYQGQLTLEMPYEPGSLTNAQQQALQLFRFHDGGWTVITTGVDTQGRTVTGQTLTNSLFAIFIATSDVAGPPDDTPPMSTVAFQSQTRYTSPGGDLYLSAPGGATLSATDAGAGVDKILFGADLASSTIALGLGPATESFYQAYSGPLSIPEGAHVLAYGARDLAGNYEVLRTTRVYVDGTPPSVSLSSSAGQYSLSAADPLVAGAASGVNQLFYLVDGDPSQCQAEPDPQQPPGTCANPVYGGPFSLVPGTHTLTIGANDRVDNSTRAAILLDVVAPDLLAPWTFLVYASTRLQGGAISVPEGALLALEAGDEGGSGVARTLLLVDRSPESCTDPLDPAAPAGTCANPAYAGPFSLAVGAHVVYFASVDGAGNREAQRSVSVTVLPPPAQGVSVDFDPDTLNLDSRGRFVTARIEAAGGSSAADIGPESVALTRVNDAALVPPLKAEAKPAPSLSDADGDGLVELALKFDRQALSAHLPVGDETRLLLEGRFKDGTAFSAAGAIRVIRPTRASAGGAVAAHPSSPARVAVPAGALAGAVDLTVVRVAAVEERREERMRQAAELRRLEPLGRPFDFGPEGTRFAVPVTLTLPFDPAAAPVPEGLKIAYWNPTLSAWEPLDSVVDAPARTVSAKTTHFSQYQVVAPAAAAQAAAPPAAAPVQAFGFVDAYAYPNPARSGQTPVIVARFGSADSVEVALFDISGRRVHAAALSGPVPRDDGDGKGAQPAFEYHWDVSGVGSGVYYFVLTARRQGFGPIRKTGRLAVIR